MSEHSPAPWTRTGKYDAYRDEIADAKGQAVATVWVREQYRSPLPGAHRTTPSPVGEANAMLIEAAPDLLEALKGALLLLEATLEPTVLLSLHPVSRARAAIAQAEG